MHNETELLGIAEADLCSLGAAPQDLLRPALSEGPAYGAAYIRVSTMDQADLSPESQLEEIRKYAQRNGIVLLQDHIYIDPGISGKHAGNRPKFQALIAVAKSEDCPFRVILVWKFARFARNQLESIFYKSVLRSKCGVSVVSITEPLPEGPFGSLIERIIEWMDEFYSYRLAGEVKRSMTINAQNGALQCAAPFGYRADREKHILIPVAEEAEQVRYIFRSFLAGKGFFQIAKELSAMGVRSHRGTLFENRTVEYILRNPVYTGKLRWNPTGPTGRDFENEHLIIADAEHEALIDGETFRAAQARIADVKAQWGRKARPASELRHWLSGIVRCASCGSTLIFSQPHYFKCNNSVRGRCRYSQHVRADLLEDAIFSRLRADAASAGELGYVLTTGTASSVREVSRLEAALRLLDTKKSRLQDAYLAGVIDLDGFSAAKQTLEANAVQMAADLEAARERLDGGEAERALRDSIASALKSLACSTASQEAKNNAARAVIERCVFDKAAGELSITYRLAV